MTPPTLSEARNHESVELGEVLCSRSIEPFSRRAEFGNRSYLASVFGERVEVTNRFENRSCSFDRRGRHWKHKVHSSPIRSSCLRIMTRGCLQNGLNSHCGSDVIGYDRVQSVSTAHPKRNSINGRCFQRRPHSEKRTYQDLAAIVG